jgi:hypothetical protein
MRWRALIGAFFWRSLAVSSSGGPQEPDSPENVVSSGEETNQTTSASRARRPARIFAGFPKENGAVCPTAEVGAGFVLEGAMLKGGEMDQAAFLLALDGENITAQADVRGTMDFPQSQGTLLYRPKAPLSLGHHRATVSFPDKTGEVHTYTWLFDVRDIPCR